MRNEGEKKTKFKIDDLPSKSFSSFLLFFILKYMFIYTPVPTAALVTTAKMWKQPKCH